MDSNASNVIRMGLKHVDPLQGVVVEHTDLHVILSMPKEGERTEYFLAPGLKLYFLSATTIKILIPAQTNVTHRSSYDPVLSCHKLRSSDREVTYFKGLDESLEKKKAPLTGLQHRH